MSLAEVTAVYYRRPTGFRFPDHLTGEVRRFAAREARHGLGALVLSLPGVLWVNHPSKVADAEFKVTQLRIAAEVGMRVPRTLVTNRATDVRAFARTVSRLVYKPLSSPVIKGDTTRLIYATVVDPADLDDDAIALTAHQFQEWVPKRYDVRLTAVGHRLFAVAIHAASEAAYLDWRSDYDAHTYEPVDVPSHIAEAVAAYLRRFDLVFGAFDFVVTPEGEWWFLECNPNGQWGWIAAHTGLPIASAVADVLTGRTTCD
nr:ATP-grasp ribosomal peptide maturase [Streptoalloteichus tenebrarius]